MEHLQKILTCAGKRNIIYLFGTGLFVSVLHLIRSLMSHEQIVRVNLESDVKRLLLTPSPYIVQLFVAIFLVQIRSKPTGLVVSFAGFLSAIFIAFGEGFTIWNNTKLLLLLAMFAWTVDYLTRNRKHDEKSFNLN